MRSLAALALAVILVATPSARGATTDWMTGLPRTAMPVKAWPGGKKVAVCFIFYVEVWGVGHGPTFRPDNVNRTPDFLNESFRQYAIHEGVPRVGRIFSQERVPMSIALNAEFLEQEAPTWKAFRAYVPNATIVAHGLNNSTDLLPLTKGLQAQEDYVRKTLDIIERNTGIRPRGWSSPSVYANAQTFTATAAAGITYTLDGMDSDGLSVLSTPAGKLTLIPYPTQTVDMGQYLQRQMNASDLERLWTDYVTELVTEAREHPQADATVVAIGLHPFVVGTPDGARALRRLLEHLKSQPLVWIAGTQEVMDAAHAR